MNKKILIPVALLFAGYLALALSLDHLVKAGVNSYGPDLTQGKVEVSGVSLSPLTGSGSLSGFVIGNPAGWSERPALALGRVQVDLEPTSVFGDTLVFNEIIIDAPEINFETKLFSSNLGDLVKNIEKSAGGSPAADDGETKAPRKFIVKQFRLTNAKAALVIGGKTLTVELAPISLDDLGVAEGGITSGQLAGVLLKKLLNAVVQSTANATSVFSTEGAALTIEKAKEATKELGEGIKKMFNESK